MSAETITSVAALAVAAFALFVSIWQGVIARRHNRLSVQPALCFIWRDHPPEPLALSLKNMGIGPAFIQALEIETLGYKGEIYRHNGAFDLGEFLQLTDVAIYWSPEQAEVLAPDMEIPVIQFSSGKAAEEARKRDVLAIQRANFLLTYQCAYGEKHVLSYRVKSKKYPLNGNQRVG